MLPANLETLSAPRLKALIERLSARSSANCTALIQAGRGMETGLQTRAKAQSQGDKLSLDYVAVNDALATARAEERARIRYQGNTRPIKRCA